ncbi:hypothetical protein SSS_09704 [Sarcoptes scabiei]|uniref:Uncharacterized protein n=1 Tax=Sarcoptes scabiei TaxID=52283 RepID=A0A834RJQ7_SARSC|nr:hypothetical protein SSS_09704 [Sarcoptes scabiei]
MLSGDHQMTRLFPVPYSKSALDQSIRVVNAFRSGIDRQKVPSPILRRAVAMKSQSMDSSYSNLFHSSGSSSGRGSIFANFPYRSASSSTAASAIAINPNVPTSLMTAATSSGKLPIKLFQPHHHHHHHHHFSHHQSPLITRPDPKQSISANEEFANITSSTSNNKNNDDDENKETANMRRSRFTKSRKTTDLDGLQDDQIEKLLRSETQEVLDEDMMDDFDVKSDSLVIQSNQHKATTASQSSSSAAKSVPTQQLISTIDEPTPLAAIATDVDVKESDDGDQKTDPKQLCPISSLETLV